MKKSFLLIASCAFMVGSQAMAQSVQPGSPASDPTTLGGLLSSVNISGVADAFAGSRQLSGGVKLNKVDSSGLTTSQINFAGEKKLADGLKAEFALGMFLRPDDGGQGRFPGDTFFGRNAYVGLGSSLGTVRLGRQTTVHFTNMLRTNSFADSAAFSPVFVHTFISAVSQGTQFLSPGAPPASKALTGVMGTTDSAWNNSVVYISPNINGTTFQAQWAPSEASGVGSRYGLSAAYSNGPLLVTLATEQIGTASVPATGPAAAVINKQSTWQLSGAYAFEFGRLSAGFFNTRRDYATIIDDKVRTFHVGATVPVSAKGNVLVQVAQSNLAPDTGPTLKRTTSSLGYTHSVIKDVDAYAVLMRDSFTGLTSGTSVAFGVRYKF